MDENEALQPPSLDWFWQDGRMGYGEFYLPSEGLDVSKVQARSLYMVAVRQSLPGVMSDLERLVPLYRAIPGEGRRGRNRKSVLDCVCLSTGEDSLLPELKAENPELADLVAAFLAWAEKHNISEWWIWDEAIRALDMAEKPLYAFGYFFGNAGLAQGCPVHDEIYRYGVSGSEIVKTIEPSEDRDGRTFLFEPLNWDPLYESKISFRSRALEKFADAINMYVDEFEAFMFAAGFARTKELRHAEHFVIAALRRVGRMKWGELANRFNLSAESVKEAVRKVEALMDVPRSIAPPGRPRGQKRGG